jgi:hypothetical protein
MLKYDLIYSVSEVAKLLELDKETIKKMTFLFANYLSISATPEKGKPKTYTIDDLCTLSFIAYYWEDKPDVESINNGLNNGEQFDYPFTEIITEVVPVFQEFQDYFAYDNNVLMVDGGTEAVSRIQLADSYKSAGDLLIQTDETQENNLLVLPSLYNYRHAIELYLKHIIRDRLNSLPKEGNIHNLKLILNEFNLFMKEVFKTEPPLWFKNFVLAFHDFDPYGTSFRYGAGLKNDEFFINKEHIRKMMGLFSSSIHNIEHEKNKNHL